MPRTASIIPMPPPGDALSQVLAKDHAASALLVLLHEPGLPFTRLGVLMGGLAASGRPMAEHLERFSLVKIEEHPSPFPGMLKYAVTLTPKGRRVAEALRAPADEMDLKRR